MSLTLYSITIKGKNMELYQKLLLTGDLTSRYIATAQVYFPRIV